MLNTVRLVLASGSPRRQAFLAALGLQFTVNAADVDESQLPEEGPEELVIRLSRAKAEAVGRRHTNAVVLAADTVVVLDNHILGKPADPAEAYTMLRALRGRAHQVFTAVSVGCASVPAKHHQPVGSKPQGQDQFDCRHPRTAVRTRLSRSDVWMREYTHEELTAYVSSGDPLDKAGAYAIQHPTFAPVACWQGCYSSIMGLPLGLAVDLLLDSGIQVPGDPARVCQNASGQVECCLRSMVARC